jgi:hypothetical protein
MTLFLRSFAVLSCLFSLSAFAQETTQAFNADPSESCSDFSARHGLLHAYRFQTYQGDCFLSVSPNRGPGANYRSYLFTAQGILMVFNSIDEEGRDETGARVFYFFPRGGVPSLQDLGEAIQVTLPDQVSTFSLKKFEGYLDTYSHGTIVEDRKVNSRNQGGVQVIARDTLVLDSGWLKGNDPTSDPKRSSIFYDGQGHSCRLLNNEIFAYKGQKDVKFKFTDIQLKSFLSRKCPNLKLNF